MFMEFRYILKKMKIKIKIYFFARMSTEENNDIIMSLDEDDEKTITLISNDGNEFSLPYGACLMSDMLKNTLENDPNETTIHIPICGNYLKRIVEFMIYNYNNNLPEIKKPVYCDLSKSISEWEVQFVEQFTIQDLRDIIHDVNMMACQRLLDLLAAKISTLLKGRPIKEIPIILNV